MEENKQTKIVFAVIGVVILLALTVGLSFAIWASSATGGTNTITTGTVSMSFTESTSIINLTNALPVQDIATARTSANYFEFSVTSETQGAAIINYTVSVIQQNVDSGYTMLGKNQVQLYLTPVNDSIEGAAIVNALASTILTGDNTTGSLITGTFTHTVAGTLSHKYRLRMWLPYSVDASSWNANTKYQYKLKLSVSANV